jgi:hypothetical protein
MTFRTLTPDEIETLPDEFYADVDKMGLGERYRPEMSGALIGAFDGDELVGIQGAILQVHCGPLWVAKKYRGSSTAIRAGLWNKVGQTIREWGGRYAYMFSRSDTPQIQHIIDALPHREVGTAYLMEV